SPLFPYTTLFRSVVVETQAEPQFLSWKWPGKLRPVARDGFPGCGTVELRGDLRKFRAVPGGVLGGAVGIIVAVDGRRHWIYYVRAKMITGFRLSCGPHSWGRGRDRQ